MLKKYFIPILIILLAIVFFKLMVWSKDEASAIQIDEHVWRVEQVIIKKQKLSPVITLYGKIKPLIY